MKVLVMFLFFLGIYMISIHNYKLSQSENKEDKSKPIYSGVDSDSNSGVSDIYSSMFHNSGPWLEKFIYNHPEEPKMKQPDDSKMQMYSS